MFPRQSVPLVFRRGPFPWSHLTMGGRGGSDLIQGEASSWQANILGYRIVSIIYDIPIYIYIYMCIIIICYIGTTSWDKIILREFPLPFPLRESRPTMTFLLTNVPLRLEHVFSMPWVGGASHAHTPLIIHVYLSQQCMGQPSACKKVPQAVLAGLMEWKYCELYIYIHIYHISLNFIYSNNNTGFEDHSFWGSRWI